MNSDLGRCHTVCGLAEINFGKRGVIVAYKYHGNIPKFKTEAGSYSRLKIIVLPSDHKALCGKRLIGARFLK
jgi:hypothetical protein